MIYYHLIFSDNKKAVGYAWNLMGFVAKLAQGVSARSSFFLHSPNIALCCDSLVYVRHFSGQVNQHLKITITTAVTDRDPTRGSKLIPEEHERRRAIFWELLNMDCRMVRRSSPLFQPGIILKWTSVGACVLSWINTSTRLFPSESPFGLPAHSHLDAIGMTLFSPVSVDSSCSVWVSPYHSAARRRSLSSTWTSNVRRMSMSQERKLFVSNNVRLFTGMISDCFFLVPFLCIRMPRWYVGVYQSA